MSARATRSAARMALGAWIATACLAGGAGDAAAQGAPADGTRPAPATPTAAVAATPAAALREIVREAVATLERALPPGRRVRLAILPITGPGDGETEGPLGRAIASRAAVELAAKGVDVLDPSFVGLLRDAERGRANGPLGASPDRIAAAYLQSDYVISGSIQGPAGARELVLRLVDARLGTIVGTTARTLPPLEAGEAAVPATAVVAGARTLPAGLALERAIFVERRTPLTAGGGGAFGAPEPWDGRALATGDHVLIRIRPLTRCHLAVVMFSSDGEVLRLFPGGPAPALADARVGAGTEVRLPPLEGDAAGDYFYPLTGAAGTDTCYIVAEETPRLIYDLLAVRAIDAPLAAPAPAQAAPDEAAESRRYGELWLEDDAGLRAALERAVLVSRLDSRLRDAARAIASGEALPDELRARSFGAPTRGGKVDVPWANGTVPSVLGLVEGSGSVIEAFAIVHR